MLPRWLVLTCLFPALIFPALISCKPQGPQETPGTAPTSATPAAAGSAIPTANAAQEVKDSMDKFMAARSFHATMTMKGGPQPIATEMDFVAPDRYRIRIATGTQIVVGDTLFMDAGGRRSRVPLPAGTLTQWRDPLNIQKHQEGLSAEREGRDLIGGSPATRYRVRHTQPEPLEFTYWIGRDGRPLQLRHSGVSRDGNPYTITQVYSRYDDPAIVIEAP
ncbi:MULTISPECIES: hypothetical protein [unclassified Pseudoxanthomonas]|uniref:hypothetical protein n=1 Tax=unclassified Pseudoxanthomonas TaxID=2645906 RepID=UPI0030786D18